VQIIRGNQPDLPSEERGPTFTGRVWADPVLPATDEVMVNTVFFEPGARTHWHRHGAGQLLIVTAGSGHVRSRDGSGAAIRTGDTVWIPPGEEHWHGADATSLLVHTAVSLGSTDWLDAVTDAQYTEAG
jgi:quercetin dioxygenase-like cupin family protein